jgi:dipeptidyl aminopeptidase/acylaminoacyl peptidase
MKKHMILALFLVFAVPSFCQNKLSVENILSYSFPTDLVASPTSEAFAWVENKEGVRNIWYAVGPDFEGRPLTNYALDDGQAISNLIFTHDRQHIIYVRGSGPNRRGDIPNPALMPDGASRQLWMVNIEDGSRKLLTKTGNARLHPTKDLIAYSAGGQVWTLNVHEKDDPLALFQARRGAGSLRWSPDGKKIAFVSNRGDHSFIGIYDLEKDQYQYLLPSVDSDNSPVWSPDSDQLAFRRTPNERNRLIFEPHREGLPWSILVHDLASNTTKEVWKAAKGTGSVFRSISADNQLFWSVDDRIVFPYEGDGWTHLWSIPAGGGPATLLTPGEFEVQFVSISPDKTSMLYSSNQDDIDRQHIWQVPASGMAPQQLTGGTGIEWSPVMTSGGKVAFLGSGPTTPAHAQMFNNPKNRVSLNRMALKDYPSSELVQPQQVIFRATDGMKIHGQLFVPPNIKQGEKRPALLFFHGGSRRQMLLGFHHRGYYHNAYAMNQYLAGQGYVVLSVNYRSGTGYGMEFREAINYGASGASEFNDVMGAGLYMQSRPDVDPDRIGLWGGSYGGYLTAMGLARASDLFAAGVDVHGVHDWNKVVEGFIPSYNPLAREKYSKLAYDSSPMADIKTWKSPVLFIHGDDDRNVPFAETVDIIEALRRKGDVEFEQLIFPDEVHGFLLHQNWVRAYQATADFFNRKL